MFKRVLKSVIAGCGCGLCLIAWKQQAAPNLSSPKATVRYFVASVFAKNSDGAAACIKGAQSGTPLQSLLQSDFRPTALFTGATLSDNMIVEGDADHARVAAEMLLDVSPAANPHVANEANVSVSVVEMFQLEREGNTWRIVPDAAIEKQMQEHPLPSRPAPGRYFLRPLASMAAMIALPQPSAKMLEQMRQTSAATTCISNEKQIALGLLMYVQDYDEQYPRKNAPYNKLVAPYVKDAAVFTCPLDVKGTVSYTVNPNMQGAMLASVEAPARTVLLYEGKNMQMEFRHDGKAAVAFVDGHVRLITPDEAKNAFWYPAGKTPKPAAKPTIKIKKKSAR